jgi:hypothetical protein
LTGILLEHITKLGKSMAKSVKVRYQSTKVNDNSGKKMSLTGILLECITKLGNSMASQ